MTKLLTTLLALLLLSACSSKPVLPTTGVDLKLKPSQVTVSATPLDGTRVLWGGVIINSTNLTDKTRLEVLAYPLDSKQRPHTDKPAGSRFLAYQQGYLETADYAAGRQVSMLGIIGNIEEARLGEHSYVYPTIEIEQLHLWPIKSQETDSKLHFGIGVIFRN
jgi:outer membrane lipoprotein